MAPHPGQQLWRLQRSLPEGSTPVGAPRLGCRPPGGCQRLSPTAGPHKALRGAAQPAKQTGNVQHFSSCRWLGGGGCSCALLRLLTLRCLCTRAYRCAAAGCTLAKRGTPAVHQRGARASCCLHRESTPRQRAGCWIVALAQAPLGCLQLVLLRPPEHGPGREQNLGGSCKEVC